MAKLREFSGSDIKDHVKMAALVTQGIPAQVALELGNRLGISQEKLADLIFLPKRTLHRRIEQGERLKQDESERVLRCLKMKNAQRNGFPPGQRLWEERLRSSSWKRNQVPAG
jgi:uncharacterized protein (DUF2384 family)